MFNRNIYQKVIDRMTEPRQFIQILLGPRQVGKTTAVEQVEKAVDWSIHYATADEPALKNPLWIEQQWETMRLKIKQTDPDNAVLILDEVQKVPDWSETVKRLWDEDTRHRLPLKVLLLGSSTLLIQKGLTESLAGRFEIIPATHWSFLEMKAAFHWDIEQYIYFGGYPGAAGLIEDEERWKRYIVDSLIETTISRDILLMTKIHKPVLLRRLFQLGCHYSSQILSFQKMLGQLHDAGNTTTLAHYLALLYDAGILAGVQKFSGKVVRQRGSSPKLQVLNTALISAQSHRMFLEARQDYEYWGRLVESTVGAYLLNSIIGKNIELFYWREGNDEVDFVLRAGKKVVGIEVKSGFNRKGFSGMKVFKDTFQPTRTLLIGKTGIALKDFLETPIEYWLK